ncbi:MAG: extracellular solute-binding protein [Prolixibacteraceae bacterium]
MKRKIDTHIFLLVLPLLLLMGCNRYQYIDIKSNQLNIVKQTKTINMIGHWKGEGDREKFVTNTVLDYGFKNQEIKINLKFPEEVYFDNLNREKSEVNFLLNMITQDSIDWDIIKLNDLYQPISEALNDPNWPKKYLVDFSEYPEFREGSLPETLSDETKAEWNGIIPGPYIEGQYWALWYNKKVAEKLGIEIKQFGMTFNDFAGYLKACNDYNLQHSEDKIIPLYESYVWETTNIIPLMLFASLLDNKEEFVSKKITQKRLDAWGKTLEAMEQIAPYHPVDPSWKTTEWSSTQKMMLDGECLFYINGSWMYNIWKGIDEQKVLDCVPAEFPCFQPHKYYPAGYQLTWAVPKNARNKDEAVKLLLSMTKPATAEIWGRYTKCPTGIKGNLSNAALGTDQFEVYSNYIQQNFGKNHFKYSYNSTWVLNDKNAELNLRYREVMDGEMTAPEAMKMIKREVKQ